MVPPAFHEYIIGLFAEIACPAMDLREKRVLTVTPCFVELFEKRKAT